MGAVKREGLRIAQLFRQVREIREIQACDLEAIADEDGIEICEFRYRDPGCTAMLLRLGDGEGGGIWLAPGQNRGRKRFSVAHELAHYHIPRHREAGAQYKCLETDMRARESDARRTEWEANDFAAELLMPSRLFASDAGGRDVSFATVEALADQSMYDVSMTAAAWRLVQTSRDPCALVVSTNGRVHWVARSRSFAFPLIERDQPLDPDTLAAAARRGEGTVGSPEEVPWHAWFGDAKRPPGELIESTHLIQALDQVLSLLWFIEGDWRDE